MAPSYYGRDRPVIYDESPDGRGLRFEVHAGVTIDRGTARIDQDGIHVNGAKAATLVLAAATDYRRKEELGLEVGGRLSAALGQRVQRPA